MKTNRQSKSQFGAHASMLLQKKLYFPERFWAAHRKTWNIPERTLSKQR